VTILREYVSTQNMVADQFFTKKFQEKVILNWKICIKKEKQNELKV